MSEPSNVPSAHAAFLAEVQRQERISRGEEPLTDAMIAAGVVPLGPVARAPTQQPTAAQAADRVAGFDFEMQRSGVQLPNVAPGAVDQRAVDFLNTWRRENPKASIEQLRTWEGDMAQVLDGRRYGETPEQFTARQSGVASTVPAAVVEAAAGEMARHLDAEGGIAHDKIPAALLHGYQLPPGQYDGEVTLALLQAAKAAGVSQAQVDQYIRSQAGE